VIGLRFSHLSGESFMTSPADPDARLAEARQMMRQRAYAEAIEAYKRLLAEDDRDAAAHEGLAMAAFMLKDYPTAVDHFKRVTMIDPRRPQPLVNLGAVFNRMGDYNSAITTLRKALAKDRHCAEAYYNLGLAHRGLNQSSMAVSAYKEAIRLAPEMAEAYQNLANVYVEMGNTQQAVSSYERALQIRPDFERARQGLARARDAQQHAKSSASPFGRLVDVTQQTKRIDQEAAPLRVMTEQERFDDRQAVHGFAKEAERVAAGLLEQLDSQIEVCLKDFARAFTQSNDARGYWGEYTALRQAAQNFDKFVLLLQERMDDLKQHEQLIQDSMTRDA
jgi:tetratricopeptide (TPR) repeat protein